MNNGLGQFQRRDALASRQVEWSSIGSESDGSQESSSYVLRMDKIAHVVAVSPHLENFFLSESSVHHAWEHVTRLLVEVVVTSISAARSNHGYLEPRFLVIVMTKLLE